jgi:uncharacterized protein (DUF885 family)
MTPSLHRWLLVLALCGASATFAADASTSAALHQLFDDEWSARLHDDPLFATQTGVRDFDDRLPAVRPEDYALHGKHDADFARRLAAIGRVALAHEDQVSYDLFEFVLRHRNALAPFRQWRIPLTSDEGFHIEVMRMSVGVAMRNAHDYENYIARLTAVPAYFAQHVANLKLGLKEGFTLPAAIVPGIIKVMEGQQYKDADSSPFFEPFNRFPDSIDAEGRRRLTNAGRKAIESAVLPAYRDLYAFFTRTYLPGARKTIGASEMPRGREYYAELVRYFTNLEVTPDEVHQTGLAEVARIRAQMDQVMKDTGFTGDLAAFLKFLRTDPQFYARTPQELLERASYIAKQIDGKLPGFFGKLPRMTYSVQPVPAELAPNYTGGRYSPPPIGGTTGGEFWVNTYALDKRPFYSLTALALHEGVPGHHQQGSLARDLKDVPPFSEDY